MKSIFVKTVDFHIPLKKEYVCIKFKYSLSFPCNLSTQPQSHFFIYSPHSKTIVVSKAKKSKMRSECDEGIFETVVRTKCIIKLGRAWWGQGRGRKGRRKGWRGGREVEV